ncbi:hypothetical protein H0I23_02090 [Cellulophaga sp. HaHaR_3_176]|uniref:hypothetical protein n=1 Tax=Cellulophaga sp. HaHaR_3_176 TaxID=1942464 RepID=UPI001C1F5341|nr:hypothetical protein [Cellulophaga sp. HaHaR_3_176]QWX84462.1 hypothetical protein H0I23_02090 [Cellulophaga sp. HaHaR_3_176]
MKIKSILIAILLLFSYQISVAQWTKGKNNAFLKVAAWNLNYDQHYTNSGDIKDNSEKSYFNLSIYGEYGITKKIDALTYIPFFASNKQIKLNNNETLNSIGDIDIGFRYGILKKDNWALSTTLKFGLPTGVNNAGSDSSFNTGDGEFNQLLTTELGYSSSFNNTPYYSKAYIGINNRTNNFSDEFRTGLEFGVLLFNSKFWGIAKLNNVTSLNNNPIANNTTNQGNIFGNNVQYTSFGFEGAYKVTNKIGISLGVDSAFNAKNIAAAPSINSGVFFELK